MTRMDYTGPSRSAGLSVRLDGPVGDAVGDPFETHRERWREYTASPWGRIRYALVERTLTGLGDHLGEGPWRVLDVGGGDGLDAAGLLARGHEATVVDPAPALLADAGAAGCVAVRGGLDDLSNVAGHGGFDLVLCHFVLQYRAEGTADLGALVAATRPGGLVSVVAPNPDGMVLGTLAREGPEAALRVLAAPRARTVTFDTDVRKVRADDVRIDLEGLGCVPVRQAGGRVVNDLVADNARKHDPAWFARLLELEFALHDREPFRRIGQYWHLVVRVPG